MSDFPVTAEFVQTADAGRLHDQARGDKRDWPASFVEQEDGSWVYRVDRDDVNEASVRKALKEHKPGPPAASVSPPLTADEITRLRALLNSR